MKKKYRKLRIPMTLKLYRNGEEVFSSVLLKKSQVFSRAEANLWDKAYLKVSYGHVGFNDGYHKDIASLKKALSSYTEKSLLDFVSRESEA